MDNGSLLSEDIHGEIPIQSGDDPFLEELPEETILDSVEIQSSEDIGSYNEIPDMNDPDTSSFDIGDTFIILVESKSSPFLSRITEISAQDNLIKMKDDSDRELSFLFDNGEIIMKTENYEILDMIKVISHDPLKEDDEYMEVEFDTEELVEKMYSDLAKKDDLLSALIYSMNIYENESKIKRVQETIDILLDLINREPVKDYSIPSYMVPIVDDSLKIYDKELLKTELTEEINNLESITSYEEYVNNSIRHMEPILTKNGYGLSTDEYSGNYLRNCLQDDTCFGPNGSYTYDERRNGQKITFDNTTIVTPNRLRIIGLLEEPYNEYVYSVNESSFKKFTMFEKYVYEKLNSKMNLYKKDKIKNAIMITNDDTSGIRETNQYLLHSISDNNYDKINSEKQESLKEIIDLLIKDDLIKDNIYNYEDLEKLLFKYDVTLCDLSSSDRDKLADKIKGNVNEYHKRKFYYKKSDTDFIVKRNILNDEQRVKLAHELIFKCSKQGERNEYLRKFIDLFTRSSDKEYESVDYLYNKYTDDKILCKHTLYECNISNDNDIFDTMKSVYGMPPEDGIISCRVCGCYLCNEDTTLFDGYEGDKPMMTRETIDTGKDEELERNKYLDQKEFYVKIIKDLSDSTSIDLSDKDIYEILLSFELLDNIQLSDTRYGVLGVSTTEIHPRVSGKIKHLKGLEKSEKDKKKKTEYKKQRVEVINNFQKWLKNTNIILMITTLFLLIVQTSIPSYFTNNKNSFIVLDIEEKKINNGVLKYICAKLRRLSEKYKNEEIWNDTLDLFNEKEYGTNEIEIQLGLIINHCLQPSFPRIVDRVSKLEDYIETKKNNYLKVEWPTFKPLKKNLSVIDTNLFLEKIDQLNVESYRKVYGGYTVENNSFIRPMTIYKNNSLSELLSIPEIEVYKSNAFKVLLRYVVSLYGKHDNNIFISLTLHKLINDSKSKDDILKLFTKYGWSGMSGMSGTSESSGFKSLDFHKLRNKIIPELLSLQGSDNTSLTSCYSDERSCNEFIHVLINNYDLLLLNTLPKRIYSYELAEIYPVLPFGRLNEQKTYDIDGNEVPNIITKLFEIYQKDEMNDLTKKYNDNFYTQFYVTLSAVEHQRVEKNKFTKFDKTEENFHFILEKIREKNSLKFRSIIQRTNQYDLEELKIIIQKRTENRFLNYVEKYESSGILTDIYRSVTEYPENQSEQIDISLKNIFSNLINETDDFITTISEFLVQSDKISSDQKKRFIDSIKGFNSQRVIFNSENLSSIIGLFIKDTNLQYNHLYGYLNDIRMILSRLKNNQEREIKLPKEWKTTDGVQNEYLNFMSRDKKDVYLYLHNNIFVKSKDRYTGFNEYLEKNEYKTFFKFISDKINHMFLDLDLIKGSNNSKYDNRYSNIYMKYHFMKLLNEIVTIITELRNSQSDITSDANDLFQSLEMRDEDMISEMIDVMSRFLMDLITHILFQHYDPSWLFLNEQKLDLANRLSKQKEREKQVIVDKLDSATREERFAIMEKNKMGISLFYKIGSNQASEYVKSDEYSQQTESERRERLGEIYSSANLELDVLQGETSDVHVIQDVVEEEVGYDYNEEYDNEDDDDGGLDEEQEMEYNE
jgi:hypothetical protein